MLERVEQSPLREAAQLHRLAGERHLAGDLLGAEALYRAALERDPLRLPTAASLGSALLAQGRFREGFPLYDLWRQTEQRRSQGAPVLPISGWRGEPLEGRQFLIISEEGFGDQIMFARYAARLRDLGAEVTWYCPPALVRLFRLCLGVNALAAEGSASVAGYDFYSPSSALPLLFPEDDPGGAPYLRLPKPSVVPGLSVGVVTSGNPRHVRDAQRSMPPEVASLFLALPGAVSLAPENTGARDFYDTAQIIAGLDLVISVDTAVAHLAGALGKPVWVLPYMPEGDWRWMQERADSPWYSSARVFRQSQPGDWLGVLSRIRGALSCADANEIGV